MTSKTKHIILALHYGTDLVSACLRNTCTLEPSLAKTGHGH